MVDHCSVVARGRAALLAGEVVRERPPVPGQPRWGLAAVLRPDRPMLDRLAAVGDQAAVAAGGGHWAHRTDGLHVSLCPLQPFRSRPGASGGYAAALRTAVVGLPAVRAELRTVSPHPGGVAVHVHPDGAVLDQLQRRFRAAVAGRGLVAAGFRRDEYWYSNVVHFAALVNVTDLIDWTDRHRDLRLGVAFLTVVELVRYEFNGCGMRAVTLHAQPLSG